MFYLNACLGLCLDRFKRETQEGFFQKGSAPSQDIVKFTAKFCWHLQYLRGDELDCSLDVRGFDERHVTAGAVWRPLAYVVTVAGTLKHWDTEPSPPLYPRQGLVWPGHMPATHILVLVLGFQNMRYLGCYIWLFLKIYWINQSTIKVNKIHIYFLEHPEQDTHSWDWLLHCTRNFVIASCFHCVKLRSSSLPQYWYDRIYTKHWLQDAKRQFSKWISFWRNLPDQKIPFWLRLAAWDALKFCKFETWSLKCSALLLVFSYTVRQLWYKMTQTQRGLWLLLGFMKRKFHKCLRFCKTQCKSQAFNHHVGWDCICKYSIVAMIYEMRHY